MRQLETIEPLSKSTTPTGMDIRAKLRRQLRRQFRLLDEEVLQRERAIDVYDEIIVYLRRFLYPVGMDVLEENFHWNVRTSLSLGCIVTYFCFLVHTIYAYWGEILLIMEAFSITGIGVQGIFKMHSGFKHFDFFNQRYRLLKALHTRNSSHRENNRALVFCCLMIGAIFKVFFIAYLISGTGFLVIPLYMYVMHNEKLMVLKVNVPGFDPTTQMGFLVTTGYHTLLIFMAIAGILASDLGIMLIVLHIVGIADVFKNGLKELDQLLVDEGCSDEEIHQKLLEICIMHKELIAYEEELDSCYATIVFVQVITSVACLVLSLFIFYVTQNIGSGLFIIAAFFQLLEFCMLGTALTIKNDEILIALYDIRWNALTNQQRKMWQFLLHRSQNAVEMTIGGVALLNMETFVEIIKTIYSYFAMLIQFIE